jgi:hypothetical protein
MLSLSYCGSSACVRDSSGIHKCLCVAHPCSLYIMGRSCLPSCYRAGTVKAYPNSRPGFCLACVVVLRWEGIRRSYSPKHVYYLTCSSFFNGVGSKKLHMPTGALPAPLSLSHLPAPCMPGNSHMIPRAVHSSHTGTERDSPPPFLFGSPRVFTISSPFVCLVISKVVG